MLEAILHGFVRLRFWPSTTPPFRVNTRFGYRLRVNRLFWQIIWQFLRLWKTIFFLNKSTSVPKRFCTCLISHGLYTFWPSHRVNTNIWLRFRINKCLWPHLQIKTTLHDESHDRVTAYKNILFFLLNWIFRSSFDNKTIVVFQFLSMLKFIMLTSAV